MEIHEKTPGFFTRVNLNFRLPSNLKFVVSTIPGHGNLLTMIENIVVKTRTESLSQFKNVKINKEEINSILIDIRDDFGDKIYFDNSKITIKLHYRPIISE